MLTYLLAGTAIAGIAAVLFIASWIDNRHRLNAILNEVRPAEPVYCGHREFTENCAGCVSETDIEFLTQEAERRIGRVS